MSHFKLYSNDCLITAGQPPQPPPGHHNTATAPSDKIWTMENGLVNGVQMNGLVDGMSTLVEMPQAVMLPGSMVSRQGLIEAFDF